MLRSANQVLILKEPSLSQFCRTITLIYFTSIGAEQEENEFCNKIGAALVKEVMLLAQPTIPLLRRQK